MKTFLSYFLGASVVLISLLIIPVERLFDEATDTQKIADNVRQSNLNSHLSRLAAQEISKQESVVSLKESPVWPAQNEIEVVIRTTFSEDWFYDNLRYTHSAMIELLSAQDPAFNYYVGIDIRDRKNLLSENLVQLLTQKFDALPECPPAELTKISSSIRSKGTAFIRNHKFTCRPPEPYGKMMLKAMRQELDRAISVLPDSLSLLSKASKESRADSTLNDLRSAYAFSESFAAVGYSILFFLLLTIVLINKDDRGRMFFRTGIPLVATGGLLLIPFTYLITKAGEIFTRSSMQFKLTETDPIARETGDLFVSLLRSSALHYSWSMIYISALILILGILLMIGSRIAEIKPLSPLDQRNETNI